MTKWLRTHPILLGVLAGVMTASLISYADVLTNGQVSSGAGVGAGAGDTILGQSSNGLLAHTAANTYVARTLTADTGLTCSNGDGVSGNPTCGTDTTVVPFFTTSASDPSANCTVGTTLFVQTTDHTVWHCNNTNTWALMSLGNNFTQFTGPTTSRKAFTLPNASANILTDNALVTVAQGGTGVAPASDDQLFVSSSTTAGAWKSVADCQDTTGNHLNYTASSNSFSCGTSSGSTTFDPSTTLTIYEDFLTGNTTTATAGAVGYGLALLATGTHTQVAGSAANPGLARLLSHATNDNSGAIVYLGNSSTTAPINSSTWANKTWSIDAVIIPGSNSTSSTTAAMYFGLAAVTTEFAANATRGVWIRWDSDLSDAHYQFVICNASGSAGCNSAASNTNAQVVASTINAVAGTANRLRIRHATSGVGGLDTIYFRVNDETEKTFCSSGCDGTQATYTATSSFVGFEYVTRNTTGVVSGDIDYMQLNISGLVRY